MEVCHFAENCHNFLTLTPFGFENIDPRSSKLFNLKFTGVPFHLPSLVTLALIEAEIAGRGRICPLPPSRARDSQTLSSARVNAAWSRDLWVHRDGFVVVFEVTASAMEAISREVKAVVSKCGDYERASAASGASSFVFKGKI